jgi:hypothetical protein
LIEIQTRREIYFISTKVNSEKNTQIPNTIPQHPSFTILPFLRGRSEGLGVGLDVVLESSVRPEELDVSTVRLDLTVLALLDVLLTAERSETPVLGDDDLLATREPAETELA